MRVVAIITDLPTYPFGTTKVSEMSYFDNMLIRVDDGTAKSLVAQGKATDDPYAIEAAIAARKSYIMAHWEPNPDKAEREARVIYEPSSHYLSSQKRKIPLPWL